MGRDATFRAVLRLDAAAVHVGRRTEVLLLHLVLHGVLHGEVRCCSR